MLGWSFLVPIHKMQGGCKEENALEAKMQGGTPRDVSRTPKYHMIVHRGKESEVFMDEKIHTHQHMSFILDMIKYILLSLLMEWQNSTILINKLVLFWVSITWVLLHIKDSQWEACEIASLMNIIFSKEILKTNVWEMFHLMQSYFC